MPVYIDKNGEKKNVLLTQHAIERFCQRFELVYGFSAPENVHRAINNIFLQGELVKNPDMIEQFHIKETGCKYVRSGHFDFVVVGKYVVTVEIGTKKLQHLNKVKLKKSKTSVAA